MYENLNQLIVQGDKPTLGQRVDDSCIFHYRVAPLRRLLER